MEFSGIHPLMKSSFARILWSGVTVRGKKSRKQQETCVITNFGIFLLKKGQKVRKQIPMHEIIDINVNEVEKCFTLKRKTGKPIDFVYDEDMVTALCLYIRSIYPSLPMVGFRSSMYPDEMNLYLERIIAGAGMSVTSSKEVAEFIEICNTVSMKTDTAIIGKGMDHQPVLGAIAETIAKDTTITTLKLSNVHYPTIVDSVIAILKTNTKITELIFESVSFGPLQELKEFEKSKAPLSKISWIKCDFLEKGNVSALNGFKFIKSSITEIVIDSCRFIEKNLDLFFKMIIEFSCFHHLEMITVTATDVANSLQILMMQLACSQQILLNKTLHTIMVNNVPTFAVDFILPKLCLLPNGLRQISFKGCSFLEPLKGSDFMTFYDIVSMNFDNCKFSENSLVSLFKTIGSAESSVKELSLNNLNISHEALGSLYTAIASINIGSIETFSWESNPINKIDLPVFFQFLSSQRDLHDLSISYSLPSDPDSIKYLKDLVKNHPIERLIIKGNEKSFFGKDLVEVIEELQKKDCVIGLDVTGQKIGDKGLSILYRLVDQGIVELYFDDSKPSRGLELIDLLHIINDAHTCILSKWPEIDTMRLTAVQKDVEPEINDIKGEFMKKFNEYKEEEAYATMRSKMQSHWLSQFQFLRTQSTLSSTASWGQKHDSILDDKPCETVDDAIKVLSQYDKIVINILSECIEASKLAKDPLADYSRALLISPISE